jgi:MFS family permease
MVGRAELPNAVALNSSLGTLARTVGPALAGVVIATLGVGWCFALNTASFLGVLAALVAMRPREFFHLRDRARPTLWRGTWEGIVYAAHTRRVIVLVVVAAVVMSFALNVNVLLPVLAKRTLDGGPQTFGTISACFGLGALLGALISATIARPRPQIILGAAACCGLTELVLAPIHGIALACILLAVCGFCFSNFAAGSYALLQLETPDYIRGRVLGIFVYGWNGPPAFISPLLGFLCTLGGTELAFVVSGVLAIFVASAGALALLRPAADNGEPAKPLPQTS